MFCSGWTGPQHPYWHEQSVQAIHQTRKMGWGSRDVQQNDQLFHHQNWPEFCLQLPPTRTASSIFLLPQIPQASKDQVSKKTYRLINEFCLGLTCLLLSISIQEGHSCWKQGLQWCEWKGLRLPAEGHPQDCQAMAGDPTGCKLQSSDLQVNLHTTLQYMMNAKLSKQRFWHCYESGLRKTIQTIPHNL